MAVSDTEMRNKGGEGSAPVSWDQLEGWFDRRFDERMQAREAAHTPSLAIIATKGTLDMAYPPFILASTASALGWEVSVFFTFYGLQLLKKKLSLEISPLGNPAMPMKMPFGPKWFQGVNWKMPNVIMGNVPGFEGFATSMMQKTLKNRGVASIEELRELCIEAGVKLVACQMTVDLFGMRQEEFIPEIADWIGAASYLQMANEADVNLFV
jgi:peroxiredoxin family protein